MAEQLKAASSVSQTLSSVADAASVSATGHQSQASSTSQSQSSGRHAGLSEAAFKRVVGETPPSADYLEKVQLPPSYFSQLGSYSSIISALVMFDRERKGHHA